MINKWTRIYLQMKNNEGRKTMATNVVRSLGAFGLSLAAIFSPYASATTLLHRSFEKRVAQASLIFEGEVLSKKSEISQNSKSIQTHVTFSVLRILKGRFQGNKRTLRFEGGRTANDELTVVGMPTFEIGEKVILLEKDNSSGSKLCPLTGWHEGKFSLETDSATGAEVVRDGLGRKIIQWDRATGELTTEPNAKVERPLPIPVGGSMDRLLSAPQSSVQAGSFPLSKSDFVQTIIGIAEKSKVQP